MLSGKLLIHKGLNKGGNEDWEKKKEKKEQNIIVRKKNRDYLSMNTVGMYHPTRPVCV